MHVASYILFEDLFMKKQTCHTHRSASCFSYLATGLRDVFTPARTGSMSLLFAKAEYAPRRLYHPSSPVLVGRHLGCLFEAYVQEKFWGQVTPTHTLADSYQSVFLKPSTELVFSNLNFLIFCQSGN